MYPVQIMRTIFIRIAAGILVASACTSCAGQADVSTEAGWIWLFDGGDLDAAGIQIHGESAWVIEGNEHIATREKNVEESVSWYRKSSTRILNWSWIEVDAGWQQRHFFMSLSIRSSFSRAKYRDANPR